VAPPLVAQVVLPATWMERVVRPMLPTITTLPTMVELLPVELAVERLRVAAVAEPVVVLPEVGAQVAEVLVEVAARAAAVARVAKNVHR
jgi:hypothetical protein